MDPLESGNINQVHFETLGPFEGQIWDSHGLSREHTSLSGTTCMF